VKEGLSEVPDKMERSPIGRQRASLLGAREGNEKF